MQWGSRNDPCTASGCAAGPAAPGRAGPRAGPPSPRAPRLGGAVSQNTAGCAVTLLGIRKDDTQALRGSDLMF